MLSNILISESRAESTADAAAPAPQNTLMNFVPLILIFLVFYFLIIRPQQKKIKEQQNMLNNLKAGDKVYTNGGIVASVKSIDSKENIVDLEIAHGVIIKIVKSNIASVVKDKDHDHDHSHGHKGHKADKKSKNHK